MMLFAIMAIGPAIGDEPNLFKRPVCMFCSFSATIGIGVPQSDDVRCGTGKGGKLRGSMFVFRWPARLDELVNGRYENALPGVNCLYFVPHVNWWKRKSDSGDDDGVSGCGDSTTGGRVTSSSEWL